MNIRPILIISLLSLFAFGVSAQQSNDALKSLVNQMTSAQTEYDAKKLDSILTADYIEISPLGEFDTRDKVLGFYSAEAKAAAGAMKAMVEVTEFSIRDYGKSAIVIARLNYTMTVDGKPLPPRSIRATYVMRKEKSAWKIASVQYTGIRPPSPPKQ